MSYKTIVVHVDDSIHAAERVRVAVALAAEYGAHLTGVAASGVSRFAYPDSWPEAAPALPAGKFGDMQERNRAALRVFEQTALAAGVTALESVLAEDDAAGALESRARYADLVVVSQTDRDDASARAPTLLPEYLVLNTGRPVLIVPYAGTFATVGRNALVAWDESVEATRAIANALPMLARARQVTVAVFDASPSDGEQRGRDIALYMARHDVRCEVSPQSNTLAVGPSLLSMACDLGSDLIVMGGYGHSRLRELLLGGATAAILESMTVPVLMSH